MKLLKMAALKKVTKVLTGTEAQIREQLVDLVIAAVGMVDIDGGCSEGAAPGHYRTTKHRQALAAAVLDGVSERPGLPRERWLARARGRMVMGLYDAVLDAPAELQRALDRAVMAGDLAGAVRVVAGEI